MNMNRPTVLILSSDGAFSREITANWPQGDSNSEAPEFVILSSSLSRSLSSNLNGGHYDLAIADASADQNLDNKVQSRKKSERELLSFASSKPAIVIHSDSARDFCVVKETVIELRREPLIWPAITGIIGREILRRRQAESRNREAEKICSAARAEATLGRYMVEMRTNVNNALTTMLGNAELLANESGLPANVHLQAETIRNMALRLHEIFQRFSSLEKELAIAARDPEKKALSATAGRS